MQTDEVKAAACVLKEPFLTFERILGLVRPGSRAFFLNAIHPTEKKKSVCISRLSVVKMCVVGTQKPT